MTVAIVVYKGLIPVVGRILTKYEYTDEETTKFDYTLNKDGYLESCTVTYTSVETTKRSFTDKNGDGVITDDERNVTETRTRTDIVIYTFKWE